MSRGLEMARTAKGPSRTCGRDGHLIALRLRRGPYDLMVSVTPICEDCGNIFLPPAKMVGRDADWLMEQVEKARFAPDAPPEAYEALLQKEEK